MATAIFVITVTGCSDASKAKHEAEVAKAAQAKAEAELAKAQAETTKAKSQSKGNALPTVPNPGQEEAKKKELARQEAERKEKALEQAIQNATILQAPPRGKGKASNSDNFLQSMRELAGNEFKFRQAREVVYRSTFNQKDQEQVVSWHLARNAILDPGKYDFDAKVYTVPLHFDYWYYKQSTGLGGKILPETSDYVSVLAKIDMDQDTAAKMRHGFDKRLLSLTIWYRLRSVIKASWEPNPHWTDGRLAHAIYLL